MIQVEAQGSDTFRVTVSEGGGETVHNVTVRPEVHQRLTGGAATPEELLEASFEFLLQREPKESILRSFEIELIGRYFPEYEGEMRGRFG